ncbi:hypothetical protein [Lentilactobacillus senioris]|uniref:hypothetical protein n=1 Tax=Lentilactobacillus senioris TaxID=931534 RepID=UPI0006CF81D7|nr:hypothetical protein [Lentilactobacillus senioris]
MAPDLILLFTNTTEYRRPKVFENILNGKKTVSNLFWGGLEYGLLPELGMLHGKNIQIKPEDIGNLIENKLVVTDESGAIKLTELGDQKQRQLSRLLPPLLGDVTKSLRVNQFKDRFLLASQVTSEYSYQNTKYYPLSIQLFDSFVVKRWFQVNKAQLPTALLTPLTQYLTDLKPQLADIFARELVGHENGGQTYQQLALELQVTPEIVELISLHLYTNFADYLMNHSQNTLQPLVTDLWGGDNWTTSLSKPTSYLLIIMHLLNKLLSKDKSDLLRLENTY